MTRTDPQPCRLSRIRALYGCPERWHFQRREGKAAAYGGGKRSKGQGGTSYLGFSRAIVRASCFEAGGSRSIHGSRPGGQVEVMCRQYSVSLSAVIPSHHLRLHVLQTSSTSIARLVNETLRAGPLGHRVGSAMQSALCWPTANMMVVGDHAMFGHRLTLQRMFE